MFLLSSSLTFTISLLSFKNISCLVFLFLLITLGHSISFTLLLCVCVCVCVIRNELWKKNPSRRNIYEFRSGNLFQTHIFKPQSRQERNQHKREIKKPPWCGCVCVCVAVSWLPRLVYKINVDRFCCKSGRCGVGGRE